MARSTYMADTAASKSTEELTDVWEAVHAAEAQSETIDERVTSSIIITPAQSEAIVDEPHKNVPVSDMSV